MKRFALALVIPLLLTGCARSDRQGTNADHVTYTPVELPDGRTVDCIVYAVGYKGGLSCDWSSQ